MGKNAAITVINFVKDNWKQLGLFFVHPIAGAIALLYKLNPKFKAWVDNLITSIKNWFKNIVDVGKNLVTGIWNGIKNAKDLLLRVQARGNVPQEFFAQLCDMSIDEGTKFAEALLAVNDDTFNAYMQDWEDKQAVTSELSKMVYADEAEQAKEEIQTSFENFDTDLSEQGKQNAQSWGEGFIEQIKQIMPNIKASINSSFSNIVSGGQLAYAGAGISNTYSSTYYVQAAEGESTQNQIWALRNTEFLKNRKHNVDK